MPSPRLNPFEAAQAANAVVTAQSSRRLGLDVRTTPASPQPPPAYTSRDAPYGTGSSVTPGGGGLAYGTGSSVTGLGEGATSGEAPAQTPAMQHMGKERPRRSREVSKNDEFCIQNENICIQNEEFCI